MNNDSDTIAAITTATGQAGIAIVRISGPDSITIADKVFKGKKPSALAANSFAYGTIEDIDEVVLLVFRAPNSYTRQDIVEIQGHGGRSSAKRILRAVTDAGARLAEPGEFTKRAFLNGRVDLLQAEAVLDLIKASSERAAAAAYDQLSGSLSRSYGDIYEALIAIASDLEATLDFSDQELPGGVLKGIEERLNESEEALADLLTTWEEGHLLREGAMIVITGNSNVGKSTLLNKLLESDRAIVTSTPGTTRDIIEEQITIKGIAFRLFDTAGIRDSDCHIEREGISRAQDLLTRADIILYVIDASDRSFGDDLEKLSLLSAKKPIVVLNKQDEGTVANDKFSDYTTIRCSLVNDQGIEDVRAELDRIAEKYCSGSPHAVISERHRQIIQYVLNLMTSITAALSPDDEATIAPAASQLREALEVLGTIDGRVYTDELLDNIFNKFCIGK